MVIPRRSGSQRPTNLPLLINRLTRPLMMALDAKRVEDRWRNLALTVEIAVAWALYRLAR